MEILITGGAGYIGSALVSKLVTQGHDISVIDNLSKGKIELLSSNTIFYKGDLVDLDFVDKVFGTNKFDCIIHIAGYKAAGESMSMPGKYSDNIIGLINLLKCAEKFNLRNLFFLVAREFMESQYIIQ